MDLKKIKYKNKKIKNLNIKIKKILCLKKNNNIGRNNKGHITFQHRSSFYHHKKYLYLNQKNFLLNLKTIFISYVYHSYLNTNIGIFFYNNRILCLEKVILDIKQGDILNTFQYANIKENDSETSSISFKNLLRKITIGSFISNIEIYPGKGSQIFKSAGTFGQIINIFDFFKNYILIKSGSNSQNEFIFNCNSFCILGINNNKNFNEMKKTKAGQNRWIGKKSHVRGVAMNPIDHPHGGGQGKTSGGRCSVSPYGILTKGKKTKKFKFIKFFIKKIKEKNNINNIISYA